MRAAPPGSVPTAVAVRSPGPGAREATLRPDLAAVGALIVGISFVQLASGFVGTLVSMRVKSLGFGDYLSGAVLAAYYVGYTLGAARAGRLINQVGHIRAFAAFAGLVGAAVALQPVLPRAAFWVLARLATGFGTAGLYIATESWLNAKASPSSRSAVFALYMVATAATFGSGQFLLNIGDSQDLELFALAAALFCMGLIPVSTTKAEVPRLPPGPRLSLVELRRLAPVAVLGCAVGGLIGSTFFTLVPVYGTKEGLPAARISLLVATAVFGGLAFQVPVGWLSDRLDRRIVAALLSVGVTAAALAFVAVRAPGGWAPLVLIFIFGGFMATIYPVCVAHATDRVAPERAVAVSGQLILTYGTAACLGPIIGTWIMDHDSISGVFLFMAAVMVPLALFALYRVVTVGRAASKDRPFTILDQSVGQQLAHTAALPEAGPAPARIAIEDAS
jgi:MFS family permease